LRSCSLLLAAGLLFGSGPAAARAPRVTTRGVIALKQRTTAPTFTKRPLRFLDRGKHVALGNGLWAEQDQMHLLRLRDLERRVVRVPFGAFVRSNPGMKLDQADTRPVHKQFEVQQLLFYDEQNGEAGVEVSDRLSRRHVRRHFFLHWDLKKDAITEATLVARSKPGKTLSSSLPLGYDHDRREFFFVRQIYTWSKDGKRQGRTVTVVGFKAGKPRVVVQFDSGRSIQRRTHFDGRRRRVLLTEYAELADKDPAPKGFLVDLVRGKVRSFEIPLTAYGAAFDPGGELLHIYSSQLGELWTLHAATGTKSAPALKVGKQGHALGVLGPGRLMLIRNSGLRLLRLKKGRPRKGRFVRIKAVYPGFSHVEGSLVLPGGALIKNGDKLYVTTVR
jgi:hypothetical protein